MRCAFLWSCLAVLGFQGTVECADVIERSILYPARPIKVIVPFAAGGGSDTFARIIQRAFEDEQLLPQPLVILNVPGAGGSIGSRRVKNARPDGYTILLLHDGILTAKYSGQTFYGPEVFEPIAGTGDVGLVIATRNNSKHENLAQLMDSARDAPDDIIFSANIGAPSHFAGLMLENASPGSRFRYVQNGGGAKRFAALLGGHADVSVFSVAEYIQFQSSGLRALAYCGQEAHPKISAQTAATLGYDVVIGNMQFWWAPNGTAPEKREILSRAIERAMQSDQVRERLSTLSVEPVFLDGTSLQRELEERERRISVVAQRPTIPLPNFPLIIFAIVIALGGAVVVERVLALRCSSTARSGVNSKLSPATIGGEGRESQIMSPMHEGSAILLTPNWMLVTTAMLTIAYVCVMQLELCGYRLATMIYVASVGLVLSRGDKRLVPAVILVSLMLSLGLHAVMTQVFVIDLP